MPQGLIEASTSAPTRSLLTSTGVLPYPGGDKIQYLTGNLYWTLYSLANSALLGAPAIASNANQLFLDGDWEMPGFSTTSATSNTIASSGTLTFTVAVPPGAAPLTWLTPGSSVLIYGTTITNFMVATVVSLVGTTLVVTATADGGSGTLTSWTIIPQAATGIQGINYNCAGFAIDPSGQNPYNGTIVEVPAGFILGAETALNISTNQILWIAYR
jgi:hypothetical protein